MNVHHYKSVEVDAYSDTGVYLGKRRQLVSNPNQNPSVNAAIFDYEEYEQQSAYGYDHSAYAPDLGDK